MRLEYPRCWACSRGMERRGRGQMIKEAILRRRVYFGTIREDARERDCDVGRESL